MLKIGLTGGIGSGKTTVAELFKKHTACVIDADHIALQITQPGSLCFQAIVEHFGAEVVNQQGKLDRNRLRKIIFAVDNERIWLENTLHPIIRQQMFQQADQSQSPYCILVIPLLVENNLADKLDRVLVVDCSQEQQLQRSSTRDQSTTEQIRAIIAKQCTRNERLAIADDIIINDKDIAYLKQQVAKLHQKYLSLAN